jgi:hypothetical protein
MNSDKPQSNRFLIRDSIMLLHYMVFHQENYFRSAIDG